MADHTPTTCEVRESHAFHVQASIAGGTFGQGLAEFDRWLAAHDAEVARAAAQNALREAADHFRSLVDVPDPWYWADSADILDARIVRGGAS